MKKIINPWRNHEGYNCFGCSPDNPKLQTSGYTVQLNVKFHKAVPTSEPELTIRAKVSKQVRNLAYISAEIINSKGELCNEGEAIYFLMNEEKAKEMGFLRCEVEDD